MKNPKHHPRCLVYLHPAAASSPAAIRTIQQQVGLLLIITPKNRRDQVNPAFATAEQSNPWGGDAA